MSGIVDLISELETSELGQQVIDTVCSHFSELLLFPWFLRLTQMQPLPVSVFINLGVTSP